MSFKRHAQIFKNKKTHYFKLKMIILKKSQKILTYENYGIYTVDFVLFYTLFTMFHHCWTLWLQAYRCKIKVRTQNWAKIKNFLWRFLKLYLFKACSFRESKTRTEHPAQLKEKSENSVQTISCLTIANLF